MNLTAFLASLVFSILLFAACQSDSDIQQASDGDLIPSDGDDEIVEGDTPTDGDVTEAEIETDISSCLNEGSKGATSACLKPVQTPEYYIEQSLKYFDTLDIDADPDSIPNYSELVARWEWPPWLKLTGFDRETMNSTAAILRQFDPSTVPQRDCRAFDVQPFGRCYITFEYEGRPCPIYEEFTFNDEGEMTFIEAWSDLPGMLPMSKTDDPWAEGEDMHRLSTRVPGLGKPDGLIDLDSRWMRAAEAADEEVADFAKRARDQWKFWVEEVEAAGDDLYARGCGW